MKWFKFYGQDWHTDPKIVSMSMEDRLCLLALFTLASSEGKDGLIPNLTEESLIKLAGIPDYPTESDNPYERALGVLKRYEALQIVTFGGNGEVTVRNWGTRQGRNASNAEKQKRYRERLKLRVKSSGNVTVTQGNERGNALRRIDKNRIDNIYIPQIAFDDFWSLYPKKTQKQKAKLKWDKLPEDIKKIILEDIPKRKEGRKWKEGFIEDPTTYLNGSRWEDEIQVVYKDKF